MFCQINFDIHFSNNLNVDCGTRMGRDWSKKSSLGKIFVLTESILPKSERGSRSHLFRSFLISLINLLWFEESNCEVLGVRTTPRYLNPCLDLLKHTRPSHHWEGQSPAIIKASDLFVLTLYPDTAPYSLRLCRRMGTEVMGFSKNNNISFFGHFILWTTLLDWTLRSWKESKRLDLPIS